MNIKLTDREIQALAYAIQLAQDCYTDPDDVSAEVKQDFKAWKRILTKMGYTN